MPENTLEDAVMGTSPHDVHDLTQTIARADLPPGEGWPDQEDPAPPVVELISPEIWAEQWGLAHDMAGGMIQMRTGAPCALGAQARSEGGQIAARAAYDLISISPVAHMILGAHSTFIGQVLAIGMHGFACVQIVKASRAEGHRAEFVRSESRQGESA